MNPIYKYTILQRALIIVAMVFFTTQLYAQTPQKKTTAFEVRGIVNDDLGQALDNVLISISGKTESTLTDSTGAFHLNVLNTDMLILTKEGFKTSKVAMLQEKQLLELTMMPVTHVDEKVNVAFGAYPKQIMTGAYASIDDEAVRKNAVNQVEQAMNGTLAGVYSMQNGGHTYGKSNYNFYVRGMATKGNAAPIILVDGIEGNINLLDPKEIASITVLKDAAELSMYGLRGANGVILVTTKNGAANKDFINVEMRVGVQTPAVMADKLNAYQYATLHNEANLNDGKSPVYNADDFLNGTDPYRNPDTDFPDQFLTDQSIYQNYTFSTGGGNDVAQYYCLVGYTKQEGLFDLPSGYSGLNQANNERFNFRSNLDVSLGKGFSLATRIAAVYDERRSPWMGSSNTVTESNNLLFKSIMTTPALAYPLINPDGSLGGTSEYQDNVLGLLQAGNRRESTRQLGAQVTLTKDFNSLVKGLSASLMYGFENYNSNYQGRYTEFAVYQLEPDDTYVQYGVDDTKINSTGGQMSDYYKDVNFWGRVDYNRQFGKHQVTGALIGHQYTIGKSGDTPDYKWVGTSGRLLYGFDSRYYVQLTGAYQGANNFARGNRYGFFPAASVAWVLSEESFLNSSAIVSYLKMRASYGLTGNDRTGGSRFLYRQAFYNGKGYGFGNPNGTSQGSYEGDLSNVNATWETAYKTNVGIDLAVLNNALSLTADYFYEKRTDILVPESNTVPSIIGIQLPDYNAGEATNQGIDLELRYTKQWGDLKMTTGFNMLMAKSKVNDLKELAYPEQESYRYLTNQSVSARVGLVADGIYTSQEEIDATGVVSSYGTLKPGDIRYLDLNGDGVINDADKKVIGNTLPEQIYGLHLGFEYKGLDCYVLGEGATNYQTHIRPGQFSTYAYDNRWNAAQGDTQTGFPALSLESEHNQQTSTFWQEDAKLFRLATIELGYTLPSSLVQRISISKLRVFINADNVYSTTSKRENRDFEAPVAGYTQLPLMKTFQFGVSVNL